MNLIIRGVRFLLLLLLAALTLAMPAFAQSRDSRDPRLSDFKELGSLVVVPVFLNNMVSVDGVTTPRLRSRSRSSARGMRSAPSTSR
jgi:hypothetical protein